MSDKPFDEQIAEIREAAARQVAEWKDASVEADAEAERPITLGEIGEIDDDEHLRGRVALRLLARYGWHLWPDAEMSVMHRGWLATDALEAEWANGGLDQLVDNAGDSAERIIAAAVEGYRMLGVERMAALAADALDTVRSERSQRAEFEPPPEPGPEDIISHQSVRLGELDEQVIEAVAERAAFVRANAAHFVG